MLRAVRLNHYNVNKIAHIFIWCEDNNIALNSLQILRNNDINFNKKIKIYDSNYGIYSKKESTDIKLLENINNEFMQFININCLTEDEIWEKKKILLFKFCDNNERCINENEIYEGYNIGNWFISQCLKIKNNKEQCEYLYEKLILNIFVKNYINIFLNDNLNKKLINSGHTKYICKRCFFETRMLKDLLRHFRKKNKCTRNSKSYDYSEDQLLVMSLVPHYDDTHIEINELQHLSNSNILFNNIDNFLDDIDSVYKNKSKKCKHCFLQFEKMNDLRKHIIISCFHNKLIENNKKKVENDNKNITHIEVQNNINIQGNTNSQITINNNNNYFEIKQPPLGFYENWDVSKIDFDKKILILFNKLMYSKLLEELLNNDNNLNVIIDKNSNSGIVYKDNIEEYIEVQVKDIINTTMQKLKDQLLNINNDVKNEILDDYNTHNRRIITHQYLEYTKNKDLQNNVTESITNLYENKKHESINMFKKIIKKNKTNL